MKYIRQIKEIIYAILAVTLVWDMLGVLIMFIIHLLIGGGSLSEELNSTEISGFLLGGAGGIFYYIFKKKIRISRGSITLDKIGLITLYVVLIAVSGLLLDVVFSEFSDLEIDDDLTALFEFSSKCWYGILAICIVGPIFEEICLRGVVLPNLLGIFKKPWIAIVTSALLFGVLHFNFAQGIGASIMGIVLGWIAYRTGSLLPGIIIHILNNSIATLMVNVAPDFTITEHIPLALSLALVAGVSLYFSLRMMNRECAGYEPMKAAECQLDNEAENLDGNDTAEADMEAGGVVVNLVVDEADKEEANVSKSDFLKPNDKEE